MIHPYRAVELRVTKGTRATNFYIRIAQRGRTEGGGGDIFRGMYKAGGNLHSADHIGERETARSAAREARGVFARESTYISNYKNLILMPGPTRDALNLNRRGNLFGSHAILRSPSSRARDARKSDGRGDEDDGKACASPRGLSSSLRFFRGIRNNFFRRKFHDVTHAQDCRMRRSRFTRDSRAVILNA